MDWFFSSIRNKIAAMVLGSALVVSGVTAWFVPNYAADAEREALQQRASAAAAMLASAVGPALEFQQPEVADESLRVASEDPLLRWAAVYDADGNRVASEGSGSRSQISRPGDARVHESTPRAILVSAPARVGERMVGAVALSLDAARIGQRESETRLRMLWLGLVVSVVFAVAGFYVGTRMGQAIREMQATAERIAIGNVSEDLRIPPRNDEIGKMAESFREMTRRLRQLQEIAARVAAGDLRATIDGDGELYVAFRTMIWSLRTLAGRVGGSSQAVASAAAALFAATREHEASATQQTASVEEMRRTLEALAAAADRVHGDAGQVREMAERTLTSSQQTADQTKLVSAHSDRIGEILTLIQDIADKSDLLALNAALEGTKAGEVGRGFSLVAAEMRRLSEHVMDSVRDIRKLVADMRGASHASVLATEESIKLAKDAAQSAGKISSAVSQQREGTSQVKSAAEEIVRVVNASLEGTAQITRSAEALLELSHELKSAATAFRLEGDDGADG